MLPAPRLSELTGAEIFVKYENLQVTNSFKERGALNKLASLDSDDRKRGVIAMSAGNHAQAVAYHAKRLGIAATIVMPVTTPAVKIAATKAYGADVILHGESVGEAQERVDALVVERNLIQVHPYDDARIIAGTGHGRARNARRRARSRFARDSDRRRRVDFRQRDRGESDQAGYRNLRRGGGALSVRCGMPCAATTSPPAGRRSRKASR